jgi:hypothetical protein
VLTVWNQTRVTFSKVSLKAPVPGIKGDVTWH